MSQKDFIVSVAKELLKESNPAFAKLVESRNDSSDDEMSPQAMVTPPADRFQCKKEVMASIASSRKYK